MNTYPIKKVTLICFNKDGTQELQMDCNFKSPGLAIPIEVKEHVSFFAQRVKNWCSFDNYSHVAVHYKGRWDGKASVLISSTGVN